MNSDFAAARYNLERAYQYLSGNDETSQKTREALDLLIEAVITAEHSRPLRKSVILRFLGPAQRW